MTYDFSNAKLAMRSKSEIVVDMMAALHKLDALARDMERKWGACRLPALVPDDLAKRFYSQHRKVSIALREGRNQDAYNEIERMVTAWRFLDQEADRLGAELIHPAVWEVALSDGTVAAIVQDEDSAAAVDPQDPRHKGLHAVRDRPPDRSHANGDGNQGQVARRQGLADPHNYCR